MRRAILVGILAGSLAAAISKVVGISFWIMLPVGAGCSVVIVTLIDFIHFYLRYDDGGA